MKKFYVIVIKSDSQSILPYTTQDEAMDAYHSEMAYAYRTHMPVTCGVTDTYGSVIVPMKHYEPVIETEEIAE